MLNKAITLTALRCRSRQQIMAALERRGSPDARNGGRSMVSVIDESAAQQRSDGLTSHEAIDIWLFILRY